MENLYDILQKDVRFEEGLKACMNYGVCTAICPAAEFYDYDPRKIVDVVQKKDNEEITALLKSETIWYCGECMSCKTRCPRGNTPGLVLGYNPWDLGLQYHMVQSEPLLNKLGIEFEGADKYRTKDGKQMPIPGNLINA